jgi:hypothetical protein
MKTAAIFALSALTGFVAAVPVGKRDVVWVTKTQEFVETVAITTTVWLKPGETAPSTTTDGGEFYQGPTHSPKHKKPKTKTTAKATVAAPSTYVAPSPSTPSSTYVAPTSTYVAPTSTYVAPTSTYVAPTSTAAAYTPTTSAAPPATESSSSSSGSGGDYTGELTYYAPGLGACGWTNSDSEDIVALAAGMMGEQSNGNPWCGKMITITYNGVSHSAKIVDKCPGCSGASLDMSSTLFAKFAPLRDGRLYDATWSVN